MNTPIYTKYDSINSPFRYEVHYDDITLSNDMDFECDAEREEFRQKLITEELMVYGVEKFKPCTCCALWSSVDSLWGIYATSPEEALQFYLENEVSQ